MEHVAAGRHLVIMPQDALQRVIGEGGSRMRELCATTGAQASQQTAATRPSPLASAS